MNLQQFQDALDARTSTINLNAGPSPLPQDALLEAALALLSNPTSPGMGIAEISHRSPAFEDILNSAQQNLRTLMQIPDNYKIIWMQGGGFTQFAAVVLNLVSWYRAKNSTQPSDEVVGEYVVTGSWSSKAAKEGARLGINAKTIASGKRNGKYPTLPLRENWDFSSHSKQVKPAFVYYCDNETVDGVEFPNEGPDAFPFESISKDVPVVCDMSSNFLSRPVDVSKYGIIYAGAQKNLGPSGVTVVIIREDLIVDTDLAIPFGGPIVPTMLTYKALVDNNSMFNTPPTFPIYLCGIVLASLLNSPPYALESGDVPLTPMAKLANIKSQLLYTYIQSTPDFYVGTVTSTSSQSRMNVTFRIAAGEELEKKFIAEGKSRGIMGIGGHRSVGGIRASIYNAVTVESVSKLVQFMKEFKAAHPQ